MLRREVNLVFEESAGQIGEKQAAAEMKEQQRTAMQSETYAHLGSMLFGTDWTGERQVWCSCVGLQKESAYIMSCWE
jgi:hypothetical protein